MKRMLVIAAVLGVVAPAHAAVTVTVDSSADRRPISPLIYGMNAPDAGTAGEARPGLLRLGGNRWTAYNWENNDSNAGSDYMFQNDDYLSSSTAPGAAVQPTLAQAHDVGAAALVTLPINGYVAADRNGGGDVRNSGSNYLQTRFRADKPTSPGTPDITPDSGDANVYQDAFAAWVKSVAPAGTGILFSLDNEPDLWSETHAEVHPDKVGYDELVDLDAQYAAAVKSVATDAKVTGPVSYGWYGFVRLQGAPDAADRDFLDFYLEQMKARSSAAGKRLLDLLDLHWYPEAQGDGHRITDTGTSAGEVAARVQAPRSLWDPSYVEDSWITRDWLAAGDKPIRLIGRMQDKIAAHFPGTGLAITEWNYGGGQHISGAVATADVLGIFGRYGVDAAAFWPLNSDESYSYAAFRMFRNFDGAGGAFGDTATRATTSDVASTSAYASIDAANPNRRVVVLINKSAAAQTATVRLTGGADTRTAAVYTLTAAGAEPKHAADISADANTFTYEMPALSVSVLVPAAASPSGGEAPATPAGGSSPPTTVPPAVTCTARTRLRIKFAHRAVKARVRVGSRKPRTFRNRSSIVLRNLPRGAFTLRVTVHFKGGKVRHITRRYKRCQ